MYLGQANTSSPGLVTLVLEAWGKDYTGEQVVLYVCQKANCTSDEVKEAIKIASEAWIK